MANWSVRAELVVNCISLSLDDVTKLVGLQPTSVIRAGTTRRAGARPARSSLWTYQKEFKDDSQPNDLVANLLDELPVHVDFGSLRDRGTAWVGLECRTHTTTPPLTFPTEVLARLAQYGLGLDIDIYVE